MSLHKKMVSTNHYLNCGKIIKKISRISIKYLRTETFSFFIQKRTSIVHAQFLSILFFFSEKKLKNKTNVDCFMHLSSKFLFLDNKITLFKG